ncbi:MAG TPA: hypothetical protein VMC83_21715 [Streptosporangiaceae bacterium]|nr:hypothetical protein [Streptosporangiaceae bacterium]
MTAEEVMEILRGLDAGSVAAAGASYGEAASALETLAERIAQHTRTLSEHWHGTASDTALASLRLSRERALDAAARAKRTGAALTRLGTEVLPAFRFLPDPVGQADAHVVVSRYLAELDGHLAEAADALLLDRTAPGSPALRPSAVLI